MRAFIALVVVTAMVYGACQISEAYIGTDPLCSDKVTSEKANVYSYEDFYVCLKIDGISSGEPVTAYEKIIMPKQTTVVRDDGYIYLHGKADTNMHKVYYIELNASECNDTIRLPVEIKNTCIQLPPSTIQAVPNSVEEGENFAIEINNANKDLDMNIIGLKIPVKSRVFRGLKWTRSFSSYACCTPQEEVCSCKLKFAFTDPKHPICQNDATEIEVRVYKKKQQIIEAPEEISVGVLALLAIIIIGTGLTVITQ
ncbi:MAG: hypothetical protein J7K68_03705 [Candidatus Diapherotrites archaeon]|nr:hypothetical protein [Candidatus Diapherotrites archaeon]